MAESTDMEALASANSEFSTDTLSGFTLRPRAFLIVLIAILLGILSAFGPALLSIDLSLFNIFFFGQLSIDDARPADATLGPWIILIPVIGATIVGLMARYGSERIRGHGIPEAIEAILINGCRVEPKVAALKPYPPRYRSAPVAVRGGRADHHDRRGGRLADRPVLPFHECGTKDVAGCRRCGWHVGDVRSAICGHTAGGRAAVVRVEATQPAPRGGRQPNGVRAEARAARRGPAVPDHAHARPDGAGHTCLCGRGAPGRAWRWS